MIGEKIHKFAKELWPLNRSLAGEGVRQTLKVISKQIPFLSFFIRVSYNISDRKLLL